MPRPQLLSHRENSRKRGNKDVCENYKLLLQRYAIEKAQAMQKKQIKPLAIVLGKETSHEPVASKTEVIAILFKLFVFRTKLLVSRIFSAIEISYQSIVR
jgi:hypothetical protein